MQPYKFHVLAPGKPRDFMAPIEVNLQRFAKHLDEMTTYVVLQDSDIHTILGNCAQGEMRRAVLHHLILPNARRITNLR